MARVFIVLAAAVWLSACQGASQQEQVSPQAFPEPELSDFVVPEYTGEITPIDEPIEIGKEPEGVYRFEAERIYIARMQPLPSNMPWSMRRTYNRFKDRNLVNVRTNYQGLGRIERGLTDYNTVARVERLSVYKKIADQVLEKQVWENPALFFSFNSNLVDELRDTKIDSQSDLVERDDMSGTIKVATILNDVAGELLWPFGHRVLVKTGDQIARDLPEIDLSDMADGTSEMPAKVQVEWTIVGKTVFRGNECIVARFAMDLSAAAEFGELKLENADLSSVNFGARAEGYGLVDVTSGLLFELKYSVNMPIDFGDVPVIAYVKAKSRHLPTDETLEFPDSELAVLPNS